MIKRIIFLIFFYIIFLVRGASVAFAQSPTPTTTLTPTPGSKIGQPITVGAELKGSKYSDSANANYYFQPGSTGTSLVIAGNIGIGTTNPTTALEIVGDITSKGTKWTARSAAEPNDWLSVTYGNGLFVAVAASGTNRVMTSPDGITWTARSAAAANNWKSVTYGNGLFVAISYNNAPTDCDSSQSKYSCVMTSPDGITWTARTATAAYQWSSVTYGNGTFVAVSSDGANRVMTSPDGITWTARTAGAASSWVSVTYGNGTFVAVSSDGANRVMTSPDGITWTAQSAAEANAWLTVTFGNGLFVAVAQTGTNRVMTSPDGITWTARTAAAANEWYSVTYGNGMFVTSSYNTASTNCDSSQSKYSCIMTSPNGITWTSRTAPAANNWYSVTYGNGVFVSVASSGTNRVMTSGKPEFTDTPKNNIIQGNTSILSFVGIGTTTPSKALHLYTTTDTANKLIIDAQGTSASQQSELFLITLGDGTKGLSDGSTKGWTLFGRGNAYTSAVQQNDFGIAYWNQSAWRTDLWIDSATGHVGIGTTGATANMVEVNELNIPNGGAVMGFVDDIGSTGGSNYIGAVAGSITSNGMRSGGTSYNSSVLGWQDDRSAEGYSDIVAGVYSVILACPSGYACFTGLFGGTSATANFVVQTGNVGIGTASPAQKLDVTGTARITTSISTAQDHFFCETSTFMSAWKSTACVASSRKYKENIEDLTYGLETINQLKPVFFNYKDYTATNSGGRTKRRIGFIAEDMASLVPEVILMKDGIPDSIDYPNLAALLTKGVQEQQVQIDNQQKQIDAQHKKISRLKTMVEELQQRKRSVLYRVF